MSASGCNDEHLATDDEGVQPEVAEQRIEYSVSRIIAPFNLCKHWQVFSRSYFTNRSYVEGSYEPNNQPGEDEASTNWWKNVHLRCVLKECSCSLHDCNTDLDVLAVAKEADDEEGEDSPCSISSVGVVRLVLVFLWQLPSNFKQFVTTVTHSCGSQEDTDPCERRHNESQEDEVDETK